MNYKNLKASNKANKALKEHYQDLYKTALNEFRFEKMSVDYLLGVLDEIEQLSDQKVNPKLIKQVIQNAKERHNLDKLIHTDLIFKD